MADKDGFEEVGLWFRQHWEARKADSLRIVHRMRYGNTSSALVSTIAAKPGGYMKEHGQ